MGEARDETKEPLNHIVVSCHVLFAKCASSDLMGHDDVFGPCDWQGSVVAREGPGTEAPEAGSEDEELMNQGFLCSVLRTAAKVLRPDDGRLVMWMPLTQHDSEQRGSLCQCACRQQGHARSSECPGAASTCCCSSSCPSLFCRLGREASDVGLCIRLLCRERRQGGLCRAVAVFERKGQSAKGSEPERSAMTSTGPSVLHTATTLCSLVARQGNLHETSEAAGCFWFPRGACRPPWPGLCADSLKHVAHSSADTGKRRLATYIGSKAGASGVGIDLWRAAWVGDAPAVEAYLAAGGSVDAKDTK